MTEDKFAGGWKDGPVELVDEQSLISLPDCRSDLLRTAEWNGIMNGME